MREQMYIRTLRKRLMRKWSKEIYGVQIGYNLAELNPDLSFPHRN